MIAGLPATGKSALASLLASRIDAPCFGKDMFKEVVYRTIDPQSRDESRQIGIACEELLMEVALRVIEHVPALVVESTFRPEYLKVFSSTARSSAVELVVLICVTRADILLERYIARIPQRDPRHFDHPDILNNAPEHDLTAWEEIGQYYVIDTSVLNGEVLSTRVDELLQDIK